MYFIASHARFDDTDQPGHGTGSELSTYLRDKKEDYVFIRHSLYNGSKSEVEFFVKGKEQKKHYGFKNLPFLVRVVMEQLITFWLLLTSKKKVKVFIGIDPLNGLSGIFGRFLGKVDKAIFYTADYSKKRFENSFLNTVYHQIDLFCVKYADQVWNVSSRITSLRKEQGVEDSRNFFVPNTQEFKKAKRASLSKKNLYDLVIVSTITKTVNYPAIIRAVKKLSKKFKKIRRCINNNSTSSKKFFIIK